MNAKLWTDSPSATEGETPGSWAGTGARLILLLSSERSGSTLLRVMLGEHPRILAPSELFLLAYPGWDDWRRERPDALESVREFLELAGSSRSPGDLADACAGLSSSDAYRRLLECLPAGRFLLDKTPGYASQPEALERARAFEPFCIWLIRHPLGVIDSHLRNRIRGLPGGRRRLRALKDRIQRLLFGGLSRRARRRERGWVEQNTNLRTFLSSIPLHRQHTVYFEDLVTAPGEVLPPLCRTMGLDFDPRMLAFRKRTVRKGLGDAGFGQFEGVSRGPAASWRGRYREAVLTEATRALVSAIWRPSHRG